MDPETYPLPLTRAVSISLALHQQAVRRSCFSDWIRCALPVRPLAVLLHLHTRGPMTISWIKTALVLDGPATSILIDQLVRRGLVTRAEDPADRRRTLVCLAPAGTALITSLLGGSEARWREWFERLDHAELQALISGLNALTAVLNTSAAAIVPGLYRTAGVSAAVAVQSEHASLSSAETASGARQGTHPAHRVHGATRLLVERRRRP